MSKALDALADAAARLSQRTGFRHYVTARSGRGNWELFAFGRITWPDGRSSDADASRLVRRERTAKALLAWIEARLEEEP